LVQSLQNEHGLTGKFQFVGTQRSTCAGIGNDGAHEGYPAIKATKAESGPAKMGGTPWDQNKLPPIMAKLHPDVVLILLGVNDMVYQCFYFFIKPCLTHRSDRPSKEIPLKSLQLSESWLIKCEQINLK
jgi:hypothetical protein